MRAGPSSDLYPAVAAPSRLHCPVSDEKPLNGLKVTVKDNYYPAGVHTTMASRSFAAPFIVT